MTENAADNFDTAGRSLLATTWLLALGPVVVLFLFLDLSAMTGYRWLCAPFLIFLWTCPLAAFACAITLTRCETTIWKKVLGLMAFGISLFVTWGVLDFRGI